MLQVPVSHTEVCKTFVGRFLDLREEAELLAGVAAGEGLGGIALLCSLAGAGVLLALGLTGWGSNGYCGEDREEGGGRELHVEVVVCGGGLFEW